MIAEANSGATKIKSLSKQFNKNGANTSSSKTKNSKDIQQAILTIQPPENSTVEINLL